MDMKEQWNRLAIELGFELKQEIRPLVELPSLHKMAARAVKKGDIQRAEKFLTHPMMVALLSKTFTGSATGKYRGFEFAIFPSTVSSGSSAKSTYFVNVVLLFMREYPFGLEIFSNSLFSQIGKAIMPGSYVKIPDNGIFNKVITVKAKNKGSVLTLLSDKMLQDKLIMLYEFSKSFNISDHAIRYDERGAVITKDKALKIMNLMADAAEKFSV